MDPLSIIGAVSASGAILATIGKTVKGLAGLKGKLDGADLTIKLLIGELSGIKSALSEIQDWVDYNIAESPTQSDLVDGFKVTMEGCTEAMDALAAEVTSLVGDASLPLTLTSVMRAKFLWSETNMKDHHGRLHSQLDVLRLLLQAVQWQVQILA